MVKWDETKHMRWGDLKPLKWRDLALSYEELLKHPDLVLPESENKKLHELCLELEKRFPTHKPAFEIPEMTTVSNLVSVANDALTLGEMLPPALNIAIRSLFAAMDVIAKSSR